MRLVLVDSRVAFRSVDLGQGPAPAYARGFRSSGKGACASDREKRLAKAQELQRAAKLTTDEKLVKELERRAQELLAELDVGRPVN